MQNKRCINCSKQISELFPCPIQIEYASLSGDCRSCGLHSNLQSLSRCRTISPRSILARQGLRIWNDQSLIVFQPSSCHPLHIQKFFLLPTTLPQIHEEPDHAEADSTQSG